MTTKTKLPKVVGVFILSAVIAGMEAVAEAQTIETGFHPSASEESGKPYGGFGFFSMGGMILAQQGMNDAFAAHGRPTLSSTVLTFGGEGYFRFNRLILGAHGFGALPRSASSATHETSVNGGAGFFDVGYIVTSWEKVAVFPMLGIGGGGMSYNVARTAPASFDQVLDDPARGATLSTGGFMGQLALGIDYYMVGKRTSANEVGGGVVGLRIGYATQVPRGNWSLFGAEVEGGPKVGFGGPFLRLVIGGGGMVVE
jgi:hypothetical protein